MSQGTNGGCPFFVCFAHVLRDIKHLGCSTEFRESNFGLGSYADKQGQMRTMYKMTRKGFSLLGMGFTGREAMAWKEAY